VPQESTEESTELGEEDEEGDDGTSEDVDHQSKSKKKLSKLKQSGQGISSSRANGRKLHQKKKKVLLENVFFFSRFVLIQLGPTVYRSQ